MITVERERRHRVLVTLVSGLAILLIFTMLTGLLSRARVVPNDRVGRPVFPEFAAIGPVVTTIRVTLSDLVYTLQREGEDWVMLETGGYPVRPERLSELAKGLETLTWAAAKTRDLEKFDRIALGAPEDGGAGARLDVFGTGGERLAELIIGRRAGMIYARAPESVQTWRVEGNLPPLYTREAWLDLNVIDIEPDAIGGVRLIEASGRSLSLTRPAGGNVRDFRPAPPNAGARLLSRIAAAGPAMALTRFAPVDVKPRAALETQPIAHHVTLTHDGLEIEAAAYRESDGTYLTLHAIEAGEGATRAQIINDRAEPWAFRLKPFDWNDYTTPLDQIVARLDDAP